MKTIATITTGLLALLFVSQQEPAKPFSVEQRQVVLYKSVNPKVIVLGEETYISNDELDTKPVYGVELAVEGNVKPWIQVIPKNSPLPPSTLDPYDTNLYIIIGKPGDEFWVSFEDNETGRPSWLLVVIQPRGPPEEPEEPEQPIGEWSELSQLAKTEADKVNDPSTRALLLAAFESAIVSIPENSSLDDVKLLVKSKVDDTLAQLKNVGVWQPFRLSLDAYLKAAPPTTVEQYKAALQAIVVGLKGQQPVSLKTEPVVGDVRVAKFYANWCGPCLRLEALFKRSQGIQSLLSQKFKYNSIDIDNPKEDERAFLKSANVRLIPTVIVYVWDGSKWVETKRKEGLGTEQDYIKFLS